MTLPGAVGKASAGMLLVAGRRARILAGLN
jgi:hypothetical protein